MAESQFVDHVRMRLRSTRGRGADSAGAKSNEVAGAPHLYTLVHTPSTPFSSPLGHHSRLPVLFSLCVFCLLVLLISSYLEYGRQHPRFLGG